MSLLPHPPPCLNVIRRLGDGFSESFHGGGPVRGVASLGSGTLEGCDWMNRALAKNVEKNAFSSLESFGADRRSSTIREFICSSSRPVIAGLEVVQQELFAGLYA